MGFFGEAVTDGRRWYDMGVVLPGPSMWVEIYDGDFGILYYNPTFGGSGYAFVGVTSDRYFESNENPPTTRDREVAALVEWFNRAGVTGDDIGGRLRAIVVDNDIDLTEDEDWSVEVAMAEFFAATSLGVPPFLDDYDD